MRKEIKFLSILFFCMSGLSGYGQSAPLAVSNVIDAFKQKSPEALLDKLADDFSIAGHTGEGALFRLKHILTNFPLKEGEFVSAKQNTRGTTNIVRFNKTDGSSQEVFVNQNKDGKIKSVSLFDELYGLNRTEKSKLVAEIPFENHNGSIILKVKINAFDREIRLLFDTGADGMAVSESLAKEIGLKITRENNASVVGGNRKISVSERNKVLLDTIQLKEMGIAIFPDMAREHSEGILGNTLLMRYITQIDYDRNILSLYTFGKENFKAKGNKVDITLPSGVILLPGNLEIVEGKQSSGHFVFDTGAAYDLICFRPFVRQNKLLVSGFKPDIQSSTVSMGISSPTFLGKSHSFSIPPMSAMAGLPVTLMGGSSTNESWKPGADGSIGVRLLSRYNLTFNLADGEVFLAPNKLHGLPQDFVLRNYQFGWNNAGQLVVLGGIKATSDREKMLSGTIIQKISAVSATELAKKASALEDIKLKSKTEEPIEIKLADGSVISI